MKNVLITDDVGNKYNATITEEKDNISKAIANDRKQNFKEHLYIGYLVVGTIAFSLGILISLKRLKSK